MNNILETEWLSWNRYLSEFKDKRINILEIGSFEGTATRWFLTYLMNHIDSKIYCIDTWEGSPEYVHINFKQVEKTFNKIIKETGKKRQVKKMKMTSFEGLNKLISKKIDPFDIIYIDASHLAKDVISDMILAWSILKIDGIMILDDYEWEELGHDINRPKIAINAFIDFYKRELDVLSIKYQVFLKKKISTTTNYILLKDRENVLTNLLNKQYKYFNKLVLINDDDDLKKIDFHFNFKYNKKMGKKYDICYAKCGFDPDIIRYNLTKRPHFNMNEISFYNALLKFIFPYKLNWRLMELNRTGLFKTEPFNLKLSIETITKNRKNKNDLIKLFNKIKTGKEDLFIFYFVYYYNYIDKYLDNNINVLYYKYKFNNIRDKQIFQDILNKWKGVNRYEYIDNDNFNDNFNDRIYKTNSLKSDFIFIECDLYHYIDKFTNKYNVFIIHLLYFILSKQNRNGLLIIQGFQIPSHSVQIDFIYLLTLFYKEINIDKLDITDKCSIDLTIYGIGYKGIDKKILKELKESIDSIESKNNSYQEFQRIFSLNSRDSYNNIVGEIVNYNNDISSKVIDIYRVIKIIYDYLNKKEITERVDFITKYFMNSINLFIKYYEEYSLPYLKLNS